MRAKVTRKQAALVHNLLVGDTVGNQTRSALKAGYGNGINVDTARSNGCRALTKSNVIEYMHDIMDQLDMGDRVQLDTIQSIMSGRAESETTIESDDGKVTRYIRKPTHAERLKSIDLLAKLTGHYAAIRVQESAAIDRYRELAKRLIDRPAAIESRRKPRKVHKSKDTTEYVGIVPVERDSEARCDDSSDGAYLDDNEGGCGGEAV